MIKIHIKFVCDEDYQYMMIYSHTSEELNFYSYERVTNVIDFLYTPFDEYASRIVNLY